MKSNLEGIRKMSQIPGVIVAVDARREVLALREAKKMGVPTIAIIDTDSDPDLVDIPIPANDDSVKAINLIVSELVPAVAEGKTTQRAYSKDDESHKPRLRRRSLARADEAESKEQAPADNA
jgi:small subunit ribosomal protein S2